MVTGLHEEGKPVTINSIQSYCSEYCEFHTICDRKNKNGILKSTTKIKEAYIANEKFHFDYFKMPARIIEGMSIIERVRAEASTS